MPDAHTLSALLAPLFGPQVSAWWVAIALIVVPILQRLFAGLMSLRAERRAGDAHISDRMARLIELQTAELARTIAISTRFGADLERLRDARWSLEDQMEELRDQAIAARAMVHELERRLAVPETNFPPLPRPVIAAPRVAS